MKNNDFNLILDFIKGAISIFKSVLAVFTMGFKFHNEESLKNSGLSRDSIECDLEKCTGCGVCVNVCPITDTLRIKENENGVKKLDMIDFSRCILCANCVYNCPKGALNVTKQYKLATNDKKDLKLEYNISDTNTQNKTKTGNNKPENPQIPAFVTEEDL